MAWSDKAWKDKDTIAIDGFKLRVDPIDRNDLRKGASYAREYKIRHGKPQ